MTKILRNDEFFQNMAPLTYPCKKGSWQVVTDWYEMQRETRGFFAHNEEEVYIQGFDYCDFTTYPLDSYLDYLDILDFQGHLNRDVAIAGKDGKVDWHDMLAKWEKEWRIFHDMDNPECLDNAFVKAIGSKSKEEIRILLDMYPEELTEPKRIVMHYIAGADVDNYIEMLPEQFFETARKSNLIYAVFGRCEPKRVLNFFQRALAYDKDYVKTYRDEIGNTCLHHYLMRFGLYPFASVDHDYNDGDHVIYNLLVENGADPEVPNDAGFSYNDLIPQRGYHPFWCTRQVIYSEYCHLYSELNFRQDFKYIGKKFFDFRWLIQQEKCFDNLNDWVYYALSYVKNQK